MSSSNKKCVSFSILSHGRYFNPKEQKFKAHFTVPKNIRLIQYTPPGNLLYVPIVKDIVPYVTPCSEKLFPKTNYYIGYPSGNIFSSIIQPQKNEPGTMVNNMILDFLDDFVDNSKSGIKEYTSSHPKGELINYKSKDTYGPSSSWSLDMVLTMISDYVKEYHKEGTIAIVHQFSCHVGSFLEKKRSKVTSADINDLTKQLDAMTITELPVITVEKHDKEGGDISTVGTDLSKVKKDLIRHQKKQNKRSQSKSKSKTRKRKRTASISSSSNTRKRYKLSNK